MKIGRIVHQQVMQLKWHFLACLGLIMVLPIEEAIVNWQDDEGFYAAAMVIASVMLAPLLAGLIACANVQADLDEKRYIFWRSKPVRVKAFIMLKYFVGLAIALFVLACPIVFGLIGDIFYVRSHDNVAAAKPIFLNILFISMMAYSLCFLCNVLIRKTARAWLIGMALVFFLLLVPFILPLNLKDFANEFLNVISVVYVSVTLGTFCIAFVVSLFAAARNWHLKTNFKGLLWAGAAVVFLLTLFFSHQVANIKVLDEREDSHTTAPMLSSNFCEIDNKIVCGRYEVTTEQNIIHLKDIYVPPSETLRQQLKNMPRLYEVEKGLSGDIYPEFDFLEYKIGNDTYIFSLYVYYHVEEGKQHGSTKRQYEKIYLCSYKLAEGIHQIPVAALELSDCIDIERSALFRMVMRKIDNTLVVLIQDSFVVFKITDSGGLELIDKKIKGLKPYSNLWPDMERTFRIPLIPIQGISIQERVKLTLDISYRYYRRYDYVGRTDEGFISESLVDIVGDNISFCLISDEDVSRYDVLRLDNNYIYCKLRDARPFMVLERMFGPIWGWDNYFFIREGKLYVCGRQKLMVFDVRSKRIRKVGHWERIRDDFGIEDIEVLDNGNILLAVRERERFDNGKQWRWKMYLYLLQNPE